MNERERTNHDANPAGPDPTFPAGEGNLSDTRQRAEGFLAAAAAAIESVLSGDSAKFNQAARQEGGE